MQERGVEGRKEEWKVGKLSGRQESGVEGRKAKRKVGQRSGMQENDVEGVGRECVVREWRVEERRWQVSGIKIF